MAASRSDKVAFIVLLAGTGLPGREIIKLQSELIERAMGVKDEIAKRNAADQDEIFTLVAAGADDAAIAAKIREIGEQQIARAEASGDAKEQEEAKTARATLDATVKSQTKELSSKWFRYFLTLDPRVALRKTRCPVLALNGELDLQVPPKADLPEIEKALKEAGNQDVTVMELPGLNHLFQTCTTGAPSEYASIEETCSPRVLDLITDWIRLHAGMKPDITPVAQ
jgi:pimeloyl-ACP methyl ester carboxylesterase